MTVPSRWKCKDCDCINDKHPAFNLYAPGRRNAVRSMALPGTKWECTKCHHPASSHSFTFDKPKDETL